MQFSKKILNGELTFSKCTPHENVSTKVSTFLADKLLRRFLKINSKYCYVKVQPLIVVPSYSRGSYCSQHWMYLIKDCSNKSYSKYSYVKVNPPLLPHPNSGVMIFTILYFHYLRMLRHKFHLSWSDSSWKKILFWFLKNIQ